MIKILAGLLVMNFMFLPAAHAENKPIKKLTRGVVNIVSAPIEVPKQARAYWIKGAQKTPHILVWIASGAVWGVAQTVKRAGSGVWDVATFPMEKPQNYEPLMKPDYVVQEWPENPVSGR